MTDSEIFLTEALGSAIIDTACTRTVCGQKWLDSYMRDLSQGQVNKLLQSEAPSSRPFRFGDGTVVYSSRKVKLPAKIGQTKCDIESEVVPFDIPLLQSKMSLKKAGTVLDMENDSVVMLKQPVPLELTSSGHYCVDIRDENTTESCNENEVLMVTAEMSTKEKQKVLVKLHKQFGHASAERLLRLIQSSGNTDQQCAVILQEIVRDCDICQRYCKTKPRSAVGLPLASEYNETVAMDLHELEPNVWYLHIIDHFTRFSAGSIVKTKKAAEIINSFIHTWISIHGAPRRLYTDNGGEFNNTEIRDMAENFNIEVKTMAGYSPWSNRLLERHNMTLTEILLKVKKERGCDWHTVLDWALMAKNSMLNVHGYSPHQLVFGQNPNLPSVLMDKPPVLEGTTVSARVAEHISALHASRKAFTEAECSERIRRALRKQLRPTDDKYEAGDKVYYKRVDCTEWKGPGVVIGQDGTVVFVRHGGTLVRVHQSRLSKVDAQSGDKQIPHSTTDDDTDNKDTVENDDTDTPDGEQSISEEEDITIDRETNTTENMSVTHTANEPSTPTDPVSSANAKLRAGQLITFTNRDKGVQYTARVLGRTGKVKGQYKKKVKKKIKKIKK
uniref:Integrase catalytic domain-containing protein n=1 Tax=Oreochromis niloticus TaxID=8128 RepID=A0A669DDN2_ORENI